MILESLWFCISAFVKYCFAVFHVAVSDIALLLPKPYQCWYLIFPGLASPLQPVCFTGATIYEPLKSGDVGPPSGDCAAARRSKEAAVNHTL